MWLQLNPPCLDLDLLVRNEICDYSWESCKSLILHPLGVVVEIAQY